MNVAGINLGGKPLGLPMHKARVETPGWKRGSSGLRTALCVTIGGLVPACAYPEIWGTEHGPDVELHTELPVAEFSVQLCMQGPAIKTVRPLQAILEVDVEATGGDGGVVTLGIVGTEENHVWLPSAPLADATLHLNDDGPWSGKAGERCAGPQIVRFEATDLDSTDTIKVSWDASFGVDFNDSFHGGSSISGKNLEIRIAAL